MVNEIIDKLWNDYLAEKCATIVTEEERKLVKTAAERRKALNSLLTIEQGKVMQEYLDIVCEIQCLSVKRAFFDGSEFTAAFLFEITKLSP